MISPKRMVLNNYDVIIAVSSRGKFLVQKMDSRKTPFFPGLANTFLLIRLWEIFACRGVFIMLSSFFFSVTTLLLSNFILFNLLCCKVNLFSLNNSIQSIVLVFCCKKVLLNLFNFLLQICNNIVIMIDKYLEKFKMQ